MKNYQIFISSPFNEFLEERKLIHQIKNNVNKNNSEKQVILIDFQYGATEALLQKNLIAEACEEEILAASCGNQGIFFIGLIGSCYGWRPLPRKIPQILFEGIFSLCDADTRDAVASIYHLDQNAVPAEYMLNDQILVEMDATEISRLRKCFDKAVASYGDADADAMKLVHSITHIEFAKALQILKSNKGNVDLKIFVNKNRFPGENPKNILTFPDWDESDWMSYFYQDIVGKLREMDCLEKLSFYSSIRHDENPSFETSLDESLEFLISNPDYYLECNEDGSDATENQKGIGETGIRFEPSVNLGRTEEIEQLYQYFSQARSEFSKVAVVTGPTGIGKSSLIHLFVNFLELNCTDKFEVILLKIGDNIENYQISKVLSEICAKYRFGNDARKLLFLIDAVNLLDLEEFSELMKFIKYSYNETMNFVITSTVLNVPDFFPIEPIFIRLGEMPLENRLPIINTTLSNLSRRLSTEQENVVLEHVRDKGSPLYLRLLGQYLAQFKHDKLFTIMQLPVSSEQIILHQISDMCAKVGTRISRSALSLIAATRTGMHENELRTALGSIPSVRREVNTTNKGNSPLPLQEPIPDIIFRRLIRELGIMTYTASSHRVPSMRFRHDSLPAVIGQMEHAKAYQKAARRRAISLFKWDEKRQLSLEEFSLTDRQSRSVDELLFQLIRGKDWAGVEEISSNVDFLIANIGRDGGSEILKLASDASGLMENRNQWLAELTRFLRSNNSLINRSKMPEMRVKAFVQLGLENSDAIELKRKILSWLESQRNLPLLLRPVGGTVANESNSEMLVLEPHDGYLQGLVELSDGRFATCGDFSGILLWDNVTGRKIMKLRAKNFGRAYWLLALPNNLILSGHDNSVVCLLDSINGDVLISSDKQPISLPLECLPQNFIALTHASTGLYGLVSASFANDFRTVGQRNIYVIMPNYTGSWRVIFGANLLIEDTKNIIVSDVIQVGDQGDFASF